ncbi:putative phage DNA-directed RNA polymerase beta subunit 2 [Salmonella phage SPFM1]|nr:putative phage DNA-directed RNA polymerase beta subunit 2 [Salmonella phage SPFM1]
MPAKITRIVGSIMRIGTTNAVGYRGANKTEDGQELDIIFGRDSVDADKMVIANQLKTTVQEVMYGIAYNSLCVRFYITHRVEMAAERDEPKDGRVNGDFRVEGVPSLAEMVRKYDRIRRKTALALSGFIDKIEVVYHGEVEDMTPCKEAAETLRELSSFAPRSGVHVDSILCTFTDNLTGDMSGFKVTMTFTQNLLEMVKEGDHVANAISERFAAKAEADVTKLKVKNGILATVALIEGEEVIEDFITYNEQHFEPDIYDPTQVSYYPHTLVTKWKRGDKLPAGADDGEEEAFPLGRWFGPHEGTLIDKPGKIVEVLNDHVKIKYAYRTEQEKFVAHRTSVKHARENFVGIQFGSATSCVGATTTQALSFIDGLVPDTLMDDAKRRYDTVDGTTFKKDLDKLKPGAGNTVDNGDVGITAFATNNPHRKTMVYSTREFQPSDLGIVYPVQNIKEKDVVTMGGTGGRKDMVWGAINSDPSVLLAPGAMRAMRNYNNAPNSNRKFELTRDEMMFIGNQRISYHIYTAMGLLERSNELLQTDHTLPEINVVDDMHARILRKMGEPETFIGDADGLTPRYIKELKLMRTAYFTTYTESEVDREDIYLNLLLVCENDQQRMIVNGLDRYIKQRIDKGQFDSIIRLQDAKIAIGLTGMLKHFGISYEVLSVGLTELSLMGKSISLGFVFSYYQPLGTLAEVFGVDTSKAPRENVIVGMDKNSQLYRVDKDKTGQLADADRVELVPVAKKPRSHAIGYQWSFDIKQKAAFFNEDPLSKLPRQYTEVARRVAAFTRAVDPKNTEITDAKLANVFVRRSDKVVNDYGRWLTNAIITIRKVSHDTVALTTAYGKNFDGTWVANGVEYTMRRQRVDLLQPIGGEPTTVRFSIPALTEDHTVEKEISVTGNIEHHTLRIPKDILGAVASSQRLGLAIHNEAWAENTTDQIIRQYNQEIFDPKKLEVKAEPKKIERLVTGFVNLPNPYNPKETYGEGLTMAEAGRVTAKAYQFLNESSKPIVVERTIPHDAVIKQEVERQFDEKEDLVIEAPKEDVKPTNIVDDEATQSDNVDDTLNDHDLGEDDDAVESVASKPEESLAPSTDYEDDEFVTPEGDERVLTDVQMGRMFYRTLTTVMTTRFTSMNMGVIERMRKSAGGRFDGMDMNQLSRVNFIFTHNGDLLWLLELFGWVYGDQQATLCFKMTYNDRVKTKLERFKDFKYMRQNYYIIELGNVLPSFDHERLHNIQLLITNQMKTDSRVENYTPMLPHYFYPDTLMSWCRIRRMIEDGVVRSDPKVLLTRKKPVVGQERQIFQYHRNNQKPAMIRHHFQLPEDGIIGHLDLDQVVLAPPLTTPCFGQLGPRIIPLEKLQLPRGSIYHTMIFLKQFNQRFTVRKTDEFGHNVIKRTTAALLK